ncbi:MAG: DUF1080 domain-containing protein [Bacteroidales bacterium]|nr:DUF1080 domain-containing protein [Bacteroidales bacterium]
MSRNLFKISILFSLILLISCGTQSKKDGEEQKEETTEMKAEPNTLTQAEIDNGWVLLFDGETTEGWRGYNLDSFPEKGWEVTDGTLHVIGTGKGEAGGGGDIIYDKKFDNFELALEWKVSEGGNSGIFYLAKEIPGTPIWKSAPEMQILDNEKHVDAKLGKDGNRQAGSLYDLIPADPQNAKPAGEWNQVKILVYKGTVVHYMNGEPVLEYHLWTDDWKNMVAESKFADWEEFVNTAEEGYIGLQDHGDDVWFRNIKINELE